MPKIYRHIDFVKIHFDKNAELWRDLYQKFKKSNDVVLHDRKIISIDFLAANIKPGSRVLDAGCGAGIAGLDLVQKGFFIHGVDLSSKMIDLCRQNFTQRGISPSQYLFSVGDLTDISFPENSFDAALALGFLEYQKEEGKVLEIFQKAIKPGGILVCSGPAKIKISNLFGLTAFLNKKYNMVSINRYSVARFKQLFQSTAFELLDYKQHGYSDFLIVNKLLGYKAELLLSRMLTQLSANLPVLEQFANDLIVIAVNRKKASVQ